MGRFFRERFLLLHIRLKHFGKVPICNGKRERGIFIGDFCLPLCTRCTFMIISFLLFYILTLKKKVKNNNILINVLLLIPLIIDGVMQYAFGFESTNFRRALTGVLWGYGLGNLLGSMKEYLKENN